MIFGWKEEKNQNIIGRFYGDVFIPLRFENMILRHVIMNCTKGIKTAPFLLIQGVKGEGKTFMTETVLRGCNVYFKNVSSSVLAGDKENDAVRHLNYYYKDCEPKELRPYSVLVIDDFHLSIATTLGKVNHTTNAENLLADLMNIADKKSENTPPIIFLGNNFTELYAPLMRYGRMNIETWEPTREEKIHIVYHMLRAYSIDETLKSINDVKDLLEITDYQYTGLYRQAMQNCANQDLLNVTSSFAERQGDIDPESLRRMVLDQLKVLNRSDLLREIQKLISTKPLKLDT